MKRDAVVALIAAVVTAGICYGLAVIKLDLKPSLSSPFSTAAVGEQPSGQHVIMRVNGEAVTQEEFQSAFAQLPEETQRQLSSPQGKTAFAEQLVRYKLLEQEARRLGVEKDPKVAGALSADRTSILAAAAAQKLVGAPTDQAVRDFYGKNQPQFDSINLSHILFAYTGGAVPPRPGHVAPSERDAFQRAQEVAKKLRAGGDFAQAAVQLSDDVSSAERGGEIGTYARGQLPPEIEQRVFTMKEGEISDPLPSRFGVHIFRVGKRATEPIERVRESISRRVQQQNTLDRIEVLRKAAKVDFDPTFFPDQKPKTPPATKKPS